MDANLVGHVHFNRNFQQFVLLINLFICQVRFQHEVYPENTTEASRQVLLIQEVELRDRLATSHINKFLYQYSSEAKPKQSQAPMVRYFF